MIKLRRNSYFGDPTRARERTERARDRQREREKASIYVEALDNFLAEKVNKGELFKLQSNHVFDLYEIPKDQLRGDTLRAMLELEPRVSDSKGCGMRTTFSRQAKIDSAPSSPAETTDLKDEATPDRGSRTEYTRTSCGHNLVTPDEALRLLSNPSSNSLQSADTGLEKDLACTENVSGEATNAAAKRFLYGRHTRRRSASWCPSSTPSKDREEQEKRNLSFCVPRTPIPHISAWWNNMLMYKSQSLPPTVE